MGELMVEMGPGIFLAAVKYEATRGQEVAARRTRPLPTTPAAAFYIPDDSPGALGCGSAERRTTWKFDDLLRKEQECEIICLINFLPLE